MTFAEYVDKKKELNTKDITIDIETNPYDLYQTHYILCSKKYGTFVTPIIGRDTSTFFEFALSYFNELIKAIESEFEDYYVSNSDNVYSDNRSDFVKEFNKKFIHRHKCKKLVKELRFNF